jgi:hypothetical protein
MHVGEREFNKPLGRPKRRWEDNIKMDLRGIVWSDIDWIHLTKAWTNGGLLWKWLWTLVFRKMIRISWPTAAAAPRQSVLHFYTHFPFVHILDIFLLPHRNKMTLSSNFGNYSPENATKRKILGAIDTWKHCRWHCEPMYHYTVMEVGLY